MADCSLGRDAALASFRSRGHVGHMLDDAARLKGTSYVAHPAWPLATHNSKLTARRLVITFVPTTRRRYVPTAACSPGSGHEVR
jgi:hypothetical protein